RREATAKFATAYPTRTSVIPTSHFPPKNQKREAPSLSPVPCPQFHVSLSPCLLVPMSRCPSVPCSSVAPSRFHRCHTSLREAHPKSTTDCHPPTYVNSLSTSHQKNQKGKRSGVLLKRETWNLKLETQCLPARNVPREQAFEEPDQAD